MIIFTFVIVFEINNFFQIIVPFTYFICYIIHILKANKVEKNKIETLQRKIILANSWVSFEDPIRIMCCNKAV